MTKGNVRCGVVLAALKVTMTDCVINKKGRKTDQLTKVAEEEVEHSLLFTLKAVSNESNPGKRNSLLVDYGATSHIITEKSKLVRFDNTFDPSKASH